MSNDGWPEHKEVLVSAVTAAGQFSISRSSRGRCWADSWLQFYMLSRWQLFRSLAFDETLFIYLAFFGASCVGPESVLVGRPHAFRYRP